MAVQLLVICGGSGVKLLGQRSILGVNAELQIDAEKEIQVHRWKARDPRSLCIAIDKNIGATGLLFNEMRLRIRQSPLPPGENEYLCEYFYGPAANHLQFLMNHSVANAPLDRGLAQSPAIGGLAIRHPQNRQELEQKLAEMTGAAGIGPGNPLEVWIISSTAGGTGEGTHRFVGAFIADFSNRRFMGALVTLKFIRVGQLTYRTVNFRQTALNTFFGIAADAAFAMRIQDLYPGTVTQWFYVDLPDVGTGERSIPLRATLVEMAAKAVTLEELQDDLQKLLVNIRGIQMILTRTGYWGKDFGEQRRYYETLRQLQEKLRRVLTPDYERIREGQRRPQFSAQKLEGWKTRVGDKGYIQRHLEGGWEFPPLRLRRYPQTLDEVREQVAEWKPAVEKLVGEGWENLGADWLVERAVTEEGGERREMVAPLRVAGIGDVRFGDRDWFQRIEDAHIARSWAWYLLGCDPRDGRPRRGGEENRVEMLIQSARRVATALYPPFPQSVTRSTEAKAKDAARELSRFLQLLAEVDVLLRLEEDARRLLEGELLGVQEVLDVANAEFEIVRQAVSGGAAEVVQAAELYDQLEPVTKETWLQLVRTAARRGDRNEFKQVVLRGATGLTENGLRDVLGLPPQATVQDMHLEMASRMGKMYDLDGNEYEAPWWAATTATPTMRFEYRILPWLSPELQVKFSASAFGEAARFRYIFTKMGKVGLYVLAFEGLTLTQREGDTTSLPTFLIRPFVQMLREALSEWEASPVRGRPSGQLRIASAGVVGEPLYLPVLRGVGLTDEEIQRIGEFYQLYDPGLKPMSAKGDRGKQKSSTRNPE